MQVPRLRSVENHVLSDFHDLRWTPGSIGTRDDGFFGRFARKKSKGKGNGNRGSFAALKMTTLGGVDGGRLPATGYWLLATSYWLPADG